MHLQDVIAPVTTEEFIDRYLGEAMLLVPEATGRFARLLPWEALNAVLNQTRFKGTQMRLMRDGKALAPESYLGRQDGDSGSLINSAAFERCLADGATLVLNAVDDLFPPIRRLAEAFESVFRVRTQVNLYAGWRTQRGFDLHFDDHDTMILQVHGRKQWKVYRPTRLHPFKEEKDVEAARKPTDAPEWDGVLEDGGLVYMPRGWWHVACPLDEPSLHLTVGLAHPTAAQMLGWSFNELKAGVAARLDVPHLKTPREQKEWIDAMRQAMVAAWNDEVIVRFMAFWDSKAEARPDVHLPQTAARPLALTPETRLRLAHGRQLQFSSSHGDGDGEGIVRFRVQDKLWTCPASLVPALNRLNHLQGHSVRELCAVVPPTVAPALTLFLTALAVGGAVSVEPGLTAPSDPANLDDEEPGSPLVCQQT